MKQFWRGLVLCTCSLLSVCTFALIIRFNWTHLQTFCLIYLLPLLKKTHSPGTYITVFPTVNMISFYYFFIISHAMLFSRMRIWFSCNVQTLQTKTSKTCTPLQVWGQVSRNLEYRVPYTKCIFMTDVSVRPQIVVVQLIWAQVTWAAEDYPTLLNSLLHAFSASEYMRSWRLTQSEYFKLATFTTKLRTTPIYARLITVDKLSYYSIFTWNVKKDWCSLDLHVH